MNTEGSIIINEAKTPGETGINNLFEEQYIQLRSKEQRLIDDEQLANLPVVAKTHPHYKEWLFRKNSTEKLIEYLSKKEQPLEILEVGCGNGWLSNLLSTIPGSNIIGTDINSTELKQASRVFHTTNNLKFVSGDIRSGTLGSAKFDCIIFAASIQYFHSLTQIITGALELLNSNGEIHIIDSPIYKQEELNEAKERSALYFQQRGFPEMANYYFHHTWYELISFDYKTLYKPSLYQRLILQNKNPFPWICIKK
jgi:ubiquinone/menaquinone biosynthesis C-methylase UbiE